MRKAAIVISLMLLLTTGCITRQRQPTADLLRNGGFESDTWTHEAVYWDEDGGPYFAEFGTIFVPENWLFWFFNEVPCSGDHNRKTGLPEAKIVGVSPDPLRVHGGERAAGFFTMFRCHRAGYLQRVEVGGGAWVRASGYAHAWYTQCSTKPHDPPWDWACENPIYWTKDILQIGVDPMGGIDPEADTVVWGPHHEIYGVYGDRITTPWVQAKSDHITVFLASNAYDAMKHCDVYWDDVWLAREWRYWMPQVYREVE